jgi:hypothetical protein
MAESDTRSAQFNSAPAIPVGRPDDYLSRPGFWFGAIGVAACWLGGARAVVALERHEYVVRGPHPSDARVRIIELTPRGRRALRVMRSNALDVEKRWRHLLGEQRFRELRETLLALLSAETVESS